MTNSLEKEEQGFTIIEILIGLVVGLTLLGATVTMFVVQHVAFNRQQELSEMQQNMRVAFDMITREARMAGYDPSGAGFDGIPYDVGTLTVRADLDGDGTTTSSQEEIKYAYYGTPDFQIKRDTGGGFQPLAEDIQAFTFNYLNEDGNGTTTTSAIRQIEIQITGRTSQIDPKIGDYRYGTLTSVVTPQNLGF